MNAKAEDKPKPIKSDLTDVTVFMSGAQLSRTGTVFLNPGTTQVVFEELSPNIIATSIQASGKGDFTILSVLHQFNYNKSLTKSKEVLALEDSLEKIQAQIDYQTGVQTVYTQEAAMILANQVLGGANTGVKIQDLKDAADFFRTRLSEIKFKQIEIIATLKKLNERYARNSNQLTTLNAKNSKASSEIVVTVSSKIAANAIVSINYLISTGGWTPSYDLRAVDINSPISLNYKANVYQSSGEDWKNVKLKLSTGNPTQSGSKPVLNPWYLTFYTAYTYNYENNRPSATVSESKKMEADKAGAANDIYTTNANTSAIYTQQVETQTNVEFDISIPYTIHSDGKLNTVEIQTYSLPATYQYYCVPKLDKDAFLLAKITGWDKYNLLNGEVNLFFEGTYVGKSYLDTRTTRDTLDISLGRDKNIVITRTKQNEFSSSAFVGLNKKEIFSYEISVRNKKKQAIDIMIEDQYPISSDKDIEVERIESTGAAYNETTGKLTWQFKLGPNTTSKKYILKYSVKYPKSKTVILN